MIRFPCVLLVAALAGALAAADDTKAQFQAAFGGSDLGAKKQVLQTLVSSSDSDDTVLPLLVQAVGDRQAQEYAINALRSRTKLAPAAHQGTGGYPGYPNGDTPESWQAWLSARTTAREQDEKLKTALKTAEDAKKEAEKKDGDKKPDGKGGDTAKGDGEKTDGGGKRPAKTEKIDRPDLGRLDRVVFRSGGFLLCYVVNKRYDADGNLVSVRVVHPDEGGEETLAADLIARIDEDIQ